MSDEWRGSYLPIEGTPGEVMARADGYERGYRDALIMASKRIRALPKFHGWDVAISDEALSEREAIADFLDEMSG